MARNRPARRFAARSPRRSADSSRSHGPAAGAEESRFFSGVTVCGRVTGWRAPLAPWRRVLAAQLGSLKLPRAQVTLRLVGEGACRRLNRRFRGQDSATDVLSFPALPGPPPRDFSGYLGDLALCLPYAWRKRGRFERRFEAEAAFLTLHGLLHLSGQHHDTPAQERAMWRLQRKLRPLPEGLLKPLACLRPAK